MREDSPEAEKCAEPVIPIDENSEKGELLFVEAADASERYAIPAAFAAYAGYMDIKLGNERFLENEGNDAGT